MTLRRDPSSGELLRECPKCGDLRRTLGSRCPSCDRLYTDERGLIDLFPIIDVSAVGLRAGPLVLLIPLVNAVIIVVTAPFVLAWAGIRALRRRRPA